MRVGTSIRTIAVRARLIAPALCVLLLAAAPAWAATYYFDQTAGLDSSPDCSQANPCKTLSKANSLAVVAGDSILLKRGETWRETFDSDHAGASGNVITLADYGSGNLPRIYGSNTITSAWTSIGGNLYEANFTGSDVGVAYWEQSMGSVTRTVRSVSPANHREWTYLTGPTRIRAYWIGGAPNEAFESPQRIIALNHDAQGSTSKSYWIFQNLRIAFAMNQTIKIQPGLSAMIGITLESLEVLGGGTGGYNFGSQAIQLRGEAGNGALSNVTIRKSLIGLAGDHCIQAYFNSGSASALSNVIVEENEIFDCGHNLVDFNANTAGTTFDGIDIRYNRAYNTAGFNSPGSPSAYFLQDGTNNTTLTNVRIYYNVAYDLEGSCLHIINNVTFAAVGNTFYGCGQNGLNRQVMIQTGTRTATLYNNISMDPADGNTTIYMDSLTGKTINNNNWRQTVAGRTLVFVGESQYTTLAAWKMAASPQATNDISADPLFTSLGSRNFTLQSGSPVIDTGINAGSPYETGLHPTAVWPGSVAKAPQGNYGAGWEIGAYVVTGDPATVIRKFQIRIH